MMRWLRHHRYALRVAVRRLQGHPFSTLITIVVIALTLAVPIIGAALLASGQPLARQIAVAPELTVFIKADTAQKDQNALLDRIRTESDDDIASARLQPREQALKTLRADPTWAQALDALPDNPLPDAIVVTLRDSDSLAHKAGLLANQWRSWPHVDHVQLDSEWVRRLESLLGFARWGLGMLGLGVVIVVLATVFNTVRLQALTQREEIAVARLVGATESFVRRPFLYLGALTGLAASALAIVLAKLALMPLDAALGRLAQSYGIQWSLHMPDAASLVLAAVIVALLGAIAARLSVTRQTRF
ncbi:MAG: ABC transporter permease [Alcaligenaceae bacterium]|nr:ABC transporter permease [Alcaligenaceae bacterium]